MVNDKKTTLPFASNFLATSFLNFQYDEIMNSKLLASIEKRLNQKGNIDLSKVGGFSNSII